MVDDEKVPLRECSAQMLLGSSALHLRATGRYFRARLNEDKQARWVVAEVWLTENFIREDTKLYRCQY